jgi:hypothetical protein
LGQGWGSHNWQTLLSIIIFNFRGLTKMTIDKKKNLKDFNEMEPKNKALDATLSSDMTLLELKAAWKSKIKWDADAALWQQYALIEALYYLTCGTTAQINAAKARLTDYAVAVNTAWNQINAATTVEQVKEVVFVPPS